ncbi:MAG: phage portal protein [Vicinamibacteria bacterium]|nr:phage portal protein [Vicinamibacteria bacterium]
MPKVQARVDYEAGSQTRRTRGWNPPDSGPVAATSTAPTIRARSRDAHRNDGVARQIVEAWVDDVVGWGLTPRSLAREAAVRDRVHSLWSEWAETAGAAGEDFAALTSVVVREVLAAGECFVRFRPRKPEDKLVVPLALEVIDASRVPFDLTRTIEGGTIAQGIERDLLGRVVAYHVLDVVPGEPLPANGASEPRRIPAAAMLHVFDQERPGQVRGVSALATALNRLRLLDAWSDAVLLRQQLANLYVAFRTGSSSSDDASPWTGQPPAETDSSGRPIVALEPGIFEELGLGEEVKFSDPPDPPANQSFGQDQLRIACIAAGVPPEVVTHNWSGANDRLARVILNAWRRRVERFRWSVLVPRLLRPIWKTWIGASALQLPVDDPGARRATWRAHAWPYVHPVQDVSATVGSIKAGLTSLSAAVAEASGEDAETVLAQIAADNARADSLGLSLDSDGRKKGGA